MDPFLTHFLTTFGTLQMGIDVNTGQKGVQKPVPKWGHFGPQKGVKKGVKNTPFWGPRTPNLIKIDGESPVGGHNHPQIRNDILGPFWAKKGTPSGTLIWGSGQ